MRQVKGRATLKSFTQAAHRPGQVLRFIVQPRFETETLQLQFQRRHLVGSRRLEVTLRIWVQESGQQMQLIQRWLLNEKIVRITAVWQG